MTATGRCANWRRCAQKPADLQGRAAATGESAKLTDFADNMAMEYRIGSRVLLRPDFAEGVRAVIVDKDNAPKWDPATPEGVTEELLDAIFAPLPAKEEWKPL